ncbi:hypothetical protein [Streptomyces sp. A5-4]|uniref:hypothetical protein n=1 Tax=Streptomyces sp. A5-4 TaxID=3384771 RepID=UPI003DA996EE
MTGRASPHLPSQGAELPLISLQGAELGTAAPFYPRLGDLARDTAHGDEIGVVVALPGEGRRTYLLRPPGGGAEWSAPTDGTLRPVPAQAHTSRP